MSERRERKEKEKARHFPFSCTLRIFAVFSCKIEPPKFQTGSQRFSFFFPHTHTNNKQANRLPLHLLTVADSQAARHHSKAHSTIMEPLLELFANRVSELKRSLIFLEESNPDEQDLPQKQQKKNAENLLGALWSLDKSLSELEGRVSMLHVCVACVCVCVCVCVWCHPVFPFLYPPSST